jgi:hypothetical protein
MTLDDVKFDKIKFDEITFEVEKLIFKVFVSKPSLKAIG